MCSNQECAENCIAMQAVFQKGHLPGGICRKQFDHWPRQNERLDLGQYGQAGVDVWPKLWNNIVGVVSRVYAGAQMVGFLYPKEMNRFHGASGKSEFVCKALADKGVGPESWKAFK